MAAVFAAFPATLPGRDAAHAGAQPVYDHNALDNLAEGDPHTQYLPVDGSREMTGELRLFGNPTGGLSAVPKQYVDTRPAADAATVGGFAPYTTVHANGVAVRRADGTISGTGSGTVTAVSVNAANGFTGMVANSATAPVITLNTTPHGMLFSNGTGISAASAGLDYMKPGVGAPGQYWSVLKGYTSAGSSPSITVDFSLANCHRVTLSHTGTASISLANGRPGGRYLVELRQDATGGHAVDLGISGVKWPGGTTPVQTTTAGRADIMTLFNNGSGYYGSYLTDY